CRGRPTGTCSPPRPGGGTARPAARGNPSRRAPRQMARNNRRASSRLRIWQAPLRQESTRRGRASVGWTRTLAPLPDRRTLLDERGEPLHPVLAREGHAEGLALVAAAGGEAGVGRDRDPPPPPGAGRR